MFLSAIISKRRKFPAGRQISERTAILSPRPPHFWGRGRGSLATEEEAAAAGLQVQANLRRLSNSYQDTLKIKVMEK